MNARLHVPLPGPKTARRAPAVGLPNPSPLAADRGVAPERELAPPVVEIVVPVYNEEADLERSVRRLRAYLDASFPFSTAITIADNASTDATPAIAERLAAQVDGVRMLRFAQKGRGRALRAAWAGSEATVVAYMDVDLSTGLDALLPLVAPLISGHSEVAIGSRLAPGAHVVRGPKREVISRCYNLLLRTVLRVRFRDAQCGFKAVRTDVARRLLPFVEDEAWFFDTELLVLAERLGLRVHEVPVDWVDDPDSRVDLTSTALEDLRGIARLLRARLAGAPLPRAEDLRRATPETGPSTYRQLRSFAVIGVASTLAYVALYALLRPVASAGVANALALIVTAIGNTAANRRLTFDVRGRSRFGRDHLAGLAALGVALAVTSASIAALRIVDPRAGRVLELAVLVGANGVATVARFALLRVALHRPATVSPLRVSADPETGERR